MRSGNFNLTITAGTFRNAGQNGNWWSSRGADNIWGSAGLGGYNLNFDATGVNPSNGPTARYIGFPLRWFIPRFGADLFVKFNRSGYILFSILTFTLFSPRATDC